jgi:hypothetical protein
VTPCLDLPALGEIAGYLCKADQVVGIVADRIDDDIGPESRAVLADAPSFALEFAFMLGDPKGAPGQAGVSIFLGIEFGKGFAEDLGFLVALKALGPGIPACDDPLGIEHIDRIVGDRIDQHAITVFTSGQGFKPLFALHAFPRNRSFLWPV